MKKRLLVGLLVGGLMAAMLPGVSAAAKPTREAVTITSPMDINYPAPNTGTFTTTGGVLCPGGSVLDTYLRLDGWDPDSGKPPRHVYVEKLFTCDDDSGTFAVVLHAIPRQDGTEQLRWRIVGGTDDYAGLRGNGGGYTTVDVVNHYIGTVMLRDS